MEVHHHPIATGSHTPGKKWTHYFREFLMLFLAVFCGFLAENQREHYIEKLRAKEYAIGLYQDLQSDTAELKDAIARTRQFVKRGDSILNELEQRADLLNDSLQQQMLLRMMGYRFYNPTLGVYTQVKNSGSLRYFNKELVMKLTNYESRANTTYKVAQSAIDWRTNHLLPALARYANYRFVLNTRITENKKVIQLKPLSPADHDFLFNIIFTSRYNCNGVLSNMQDLLIKADSLIMDIQKNYHLK